MEESTEEDLESLIEELDFIPGHFHLLLNLNIESTRQANLRLRDTQMKRENLRAELESETGNVQYAIRNMLGLLAYHLDELEEAEEIFHSICQEDPGNLNAWANLAHVYERLGRDSEESNCLEQVKSLIDLETSKSPIEGRLRAARCLTEQAFAQLHDVELEQEEDLQERLTTALTLYNRALHYGAKLGLKLATDDAFTLNQLASVFFWSGKHEMSMGICNMALNVLPDAELNWKAYCTRAKLKLTNYIKALDQAKLGLSGIPDRQELREARADLELMLSVQPCLRTHLEMGRVYYYMGVDAVKESIMVDEMAVNQALVSLAQALKCPMGSTLPELQLLRGRCLMLKGEEENAIDCFRQSLELEQPGSYEQQALHFLLEALLTSFAKSTGDISHILTQVEECVKQAEERHGTDAVRAELRLLCRTYTDEVAELSRELVKKGKLGMVRRLLQSIQPQDKLPLGRSLSL
ncbi:hypothetical protein QTP86_002863 [Hemibagrus guttatus]|nr:hypothetical protein QTP86_002863 [Hemibagrus guttatus]